MLSLGNIKTNTLLKLSRHAQLMTLCNTNIYPKPKYSQILDEEEPTDKIILQWLLLISAPDVRENAGGKLNKTFVAGSYRVAVFCFRLQTQFGPVNNRTSSFLH